MSYKQNHHCWEIEMSNTDKASIQMSFFQNAERQFSRMSNENTMGKTIKKECLITFLRPFFLNKKIKCIVFIFEKSKIKIFYQDLICCRLIFMESLEMGILNLANNPVVLFNHHLIWETGKTCEPTYYYKL